MSVSVESVREAVKTVIAEVSAVAVTTGDMPDFLAVRSDVVCRAMEGSGTPVRGLPELAVGCGILRLCWNALEPRATGQAPQPSSDDPYDKVDFWGYLVGIEAQIDDVLAGLQAGKPLDAVEGHVEAALKATEDALLVAVRLLGRQGLAASALTGLSVAGLSVVAAGREEAGRNAVDKLLER